jgi:peptidoglycan/LPS O-acetylase OafA/YrhL
MIRAYREDIDWLRGLAILSVVAFHFETPVYGGYVGVDIFFVISGFLITQIIQREMANGSFSFARFYERRVRRLLPALYVMVLVTAIPAFHYLLTSERLSFFRSVASVVTFTSNFFFWSQSGYFDLDAVEKPLLHTWSLAVEEQFYLALPVLIWALLRFGGEARRAKIGMSAALVGATIASFALGLWLLSTGHSASAFYMSPARAWEFLIGSIVAIEGFPIIRHRIVQLAVLGVGYALLLIPVFGLRPFSPFPGWNALAPCLGAALFIWSGNGVPIVTARWLVPISGTLRFFGQISYSLYLWHWPMFTFARFTKDSLTLGPLDKVILFAVTVAISYISWIYVEQPFRRRTLLPTRRGAFVLAGAASACLVLLAGAGMIVSRSLSELDRTAMKLDSYNTYSQRDAYRAGSCFRLTDAPLEEARCFTLAPNKINVLLWGDSYAAHYYPGLVRLLDPQTTNLMQATQAGCMPTFKPDPKDKYWCQYFAGVMTPWFETRKPDLVLISSDWIEHGRPAFYDSMIVNLRGTLAALADRGIPVVLLGPSVQFKDRLPPMLIRAHLRQIEPSPRDMVRQDIFALDARMKAALPSTGKFTYISVLDAVCPAQQCPLTVDDGIPLAWDFAHLTVEGSEYVTSKIIGSLGLKEIADSRSPR